jgi:D-lactate dehydrogenase
LHSNIDIVYHTFSLTVGTACIASGAKAVCAFVNDTLDESVLEILASVGVQAILLRCAGYNNVDLAVAKRLDIFVANVSSYSPELVEEYAATLLLTLNRKTHLAYNRVREGNFSLEGLQEFKLSGKTLGFLGTGKIGMCFARIMNGFCCRLIANDPCPNKAFDEVGEFVPLDALLAQSDVISLHCPLLESTRHNINTDTLSNMKRGAILLNTSRGRLVDAVAVTAALRSGQLAGLAMDVYEQGGSAFLCRPFDRHNQRRHPHEANDVPQYHCLRTLGFLHWESVG